MSLPTEPKVFGDAHTKNHDWRCRFCSHDVDEHEWQFAPLGQSSKMCFHGNCKCTGFESVYKPDNRTETLCFVDGRFGWNKGYYQWDNPITVLTKG